MIHVQKIMFMQLILVASLILSVGLNSSYADEPVLTAQIKINTSRTLGPVNKKILGTNIAAADTKGYKGRKKTDLRKLHRAGGVWDDLTSQPEPGMFAAMQNIGVSVIRYPGGTLSHYFQWKKTIGPIDKRGDWHFGLDEYMQLCAKLKAQPVITVPEYGGTPQDAADLVEYLNAPAIEQYPWAMKRAANGHKDPYNVIWFELGNESESGNGGFTDPPLQFTPRQYADYFLKTQAAMKKVDPKVKCGLAMSVFGKPDCLWNRNILRFTKGYADFVSVHSYPVRYNKGDPPTDESILMAATMAAGEQWEQKLRQMRSVIRQYAQSDLPISLLEYNVHFVQGKPKPYRYSFGAAMWAADYVRILMKPEHQVYSATYWDFAGTYWAMLYGDGKARRENAALLLYELWGSHFGDQLVATNVISPKATFQGFKTVAKAQGDHYQASVTYVDNPLKISQFQAFTIPKTQYRMDQNALAITFNGFTGKEYPGLINIPRPKGCIGPMDYTVGFEAKFLPNGPSRGTLGVGIGDPRGWAATKSGIAIRNVNAMKTWHYFEGTLEGLADAQGSKLILRIEPGETPVSGTLFLRNFHIKIQSHEKFPDYNLLTSSASLSRDGKKLYVIVFNKSADQPIQTRLYLNGFNAQSAKQWAVQATHSLADMNMKTNQVIRSQSGQAFALDDSHLATYSFPPRSMTAIEFVRRDTPIGQQSSSLNMFDQEQKEKIRQLADQCEQILREKVLPAWVKHSIDKDNGGFITSFERDWTAYSTDKNIVGQLRMVYVLSRASIQFPDLAPVYMPLANDGLKFILTHYWDDQQGGWFTQANRKGEIVKNTKMFYSHIFAIYALSTYYMADQKYHLVTPNNVAPNLKSYLDRTFEVIQKRFYHPQTDLYFSQMTRDWKVRTTRTQMGDMLHYLESMLGAYEAYQDPKFLTEIRHAADIVWTQFADDGVGIPWEFLQIDQTHDFTLPWLAKDIMPPVRCLGHQTEQSFLLMQAAKFDIKRPYRRRGLALFDRMWKITNPDISPYGIAEWQGYDGKLSQQAASFWCQTEGLNAASKALLLTGDIKYLRAAEKLLGTFDFYEDKVFGGFSHYIMYPEDATQFNETKRQWNYVKPGFMRHFRKGHIWACCYHVTRSLTHAIASLRAIRGRSLLFSIKCR